MNNQMIQENSQAVQSHLTIIQNVIQRMSSNSASSKAFCITLVSAILIIVAEKEKPEYALIAFIPTLLFFILDSYYLALEKGFRNAYNDFIAKLHNKEVKSEDLFDVNPNGNILLLFVKSIRSFSVWPFYVTLLIMIILAKCIIL